MDYLAPMSTTSRKRSASGAGFTTTEGHTTQRQAQRPRSAAMDFVPAASHSRRVAASKGDDASTLQSQAPAYVYAVMYTVTERDMKETVIRSIHATLEGARSRVRAEKESMASIMFKETDFEEAVTDKRDLDYSSYLECEPDDADCWVYKYGEMTVECRVERHPLKVSD